jgi:hypothetical protein
MGLVRRSSCGVHSSPLDQVKQDRITRVCNNNRCTLLHSYVQRWLKLTAYFPSFMHFVLCISEDCWCSSLAFERFQVVISSRISTVIIKVFHEFPKSSSQILEKNTLNKRVRLPSNHSFSLFTAISSPATV